MDAAEQNKLQLLALQSAGRKTQQEFADDQAYRQLAMQHGNDSNALVQALNNQGLGAKAQAIQKFGLDTKKMQADIDLATAHGKKFSSDVAAQDYDLADKKRIKAVTDILGFKTIEDAAAHMQGNIARGELTPEMANTVLGTMPKDNNPASFKEWQHQMSLSILTPKERMAYTAPDANTVLNNDTSRKNNFDTNLTSTNNNAATNLTSTNNNILTNDTSRKNNAANNSTTMRGQNMVDARTRESNAASMSKPFEVTGADGNPVLVQQGKDGTLTPVQGYAPKDSNKALTDAQSKAVLFGSRMQASDKILSDLSLKGTETSNPLIQSGYGIGNVVSALSSAQQQQLLQAKRDFVNATLRRESGAAINQSEFDNANKQYFPQIGDSSAVIKQKAENRQIATRGIQAEIPKNQKGLISEVIGSGNQSAIDRLVNKYPLKKAQ